jgi:hypothetical protein
MLQIVPEPKLLSSKSHWALLKETARLHLGPTYIAAARSSLNLLLSESYLEVPKLKKQTVDATSKRQLSDSIGPVAWSCFLQPGCSSSIFRLIVDGITTRIIFRIENDLRRDKLRCWTFSQNPIHRQF